MEAGLATGESVYVFVASSLYTPELMERNNKLMGPFQVAITITTTSWSLFEKAVEGMIWDMAGLHPDIGSCLTSQFGQMRSRLMALGTLHTRMRGSAPISKRLRKLEGTSHEASERRNRAVHDPIGCNPMGVVLVHRLYPKEALSRMEVADIAWYQETNKIISREFAIFVAIAREMKAAIPPFLLRPAPFYEIRGTTRYLNSQL